MEKWFELYRNIVMPAHCDVYGHLNVRNYAAFFDDAGWHMPAMAGLKLSEIQARGFGTVAANLSIDFLHEVRMGELILIKGALTRVGTKSFTYEMRLYAADSMRHCATAKATEVWFDTKKRQGVALPEDVAQKLRAIALANA